MGQIFLNYKLFLGSSWQLFGFLMEHTFRMPEIPEISIEDQLRIANFLVTGLQQQITRYEHAFIQYDQRMKLLLEIKEIQKESIAFLESMLERAEGVFRPQIEKQKEINAKLRKELEDVKALLHRKNL